MQTSRLFLIIAACATTLVSCGTVSKVQPTAGSSLAAGKTYSKVIVQDFSNSASHSGGSASIAGLQFADILAVSMRQSKPAISVERKGTPDANTLVVGGDITRYAEGSAALRLLVGMGAGSSYFDADIRFSDGGTGKSLGVMRADKNSWVLGGSIAAGQTVDHFMRAAAKKAAIEAAPLLR